VSSRDLIDPLEYERDRAEAMLAAQRDIIRRRISVLRSRRPPVFADNYDLDDGAAGRLGVAAAWAEAVATPGAQTNLLLWLCGNLGNGKTWTAWRTAEAAVRAGFCGSIEFVEASEFQEAAAPPVDYSRLHAIAECGLLVLDDLGAARLSAWDQDKLGQLFNDRWKWQRPTVLTTNSGELAEMVGERAASRLAHMGAAKVLFDGPDYRRAGGAGR
jgi:DNA replication protein DnaC